MVAGCPPIRRSLPSSEEEAAEPQTSGVAERAALSHYDNLRTPAAPASTSPSTRIALAMLVDDIARTTTSRILPTFPYPPNILAPTGSIGFSNGEHFHPRNGQQTTSSRSLSALSHNVALFLKNASSTTMLPHPSMPGAGLSPLSFLSGRHPSSLGTAAHELISPVPPPPEGALLSYHHADPRFLVDPFLPTREQPQQLLAVQTPLLEGRARMLNLPFISHPAALLSRAASDIHQQPLVYRHLQQMLYCQDEASSLLPDPSLASGTSSNRSSHILGLLASLAQPPMCPSDSRQMMMLASVPTFDRSALSATTRSDQKLAAIRLMGADNLLLARQYQERSRKAVGIRISSAIGGKGTFPMILHRALTHLEHVANGTQIACFLRDGKAFHIQNQFAFEKRVLSVFFPKMRGFPSFQRQLNLYNFERMTGEGTYRGAYRHPLFVRDSPRLSIEMQRTPIKGRGPGRRRRCGVSDDTLTANDEIDDEDQEKDEDTNAESDADQVERG